MSQAWVLQGNRSGSWPVFDHLLDGETEISWSVTQHLKDVSINDAAVLWSVASARACTPSESPPDVRPCRISTRPRPDLVVILAGGLGSPGLSPDDGAVVGSVRGDQLLP